MTSSIVEALGVLDKPNQPQDETRDEENNETDTPPSNTQEPSLNDPELGKPISHGQIVDLWKNLRAQGNSSYTLEQLLRGAFIYIPPPPPKPEPSPEYKALMARLRREEEARSYERMLNPVHHETFQDRFPYSASAFAEVNKPTSAADIGDEDVTMNEVHRQVTLIINFLVSIAGVAGTLWVAARWWSLPSRLFLTLGGSILVAIAEVVVYSGYMWRMEEARKKDGKVKEVKEVVESWIVGEDENKDEKTVLIKEKEDDGNDTVRKRRTEQKVETQSPAPSRPRPRAKLRTYGKRSARDDSPREPSPKKRRIETEQPLLKKSDSKSDNVESLSLPKIASEGSKDTSKPATTTGKSVTNVAKKGSILSFFKPISSSSSTIVSSPKSDEPQPESTPPSSPPHPPRIEPRKKPRLLRFRGTSMPILDSEDTDTDAQREEKTEEAADKERAREPLRERQGSLVNQESAATGTKPKKQKAKSSTVQTTLNLSSQAAFSECKVCNTVWNPLYPDDVKFHTKQHAAVLRARKKSQEDEL
ncbi:hypothetical protein NM208_g9398 [Fusarium decemcellulare]|uniref:Uncharacterized protein n=1 Tax=Fusarium decemcellulare TaxID=57161 RepID=A0ACC1S207_9HYPO|nr:hypothetical protein NM208_g9398 [Fusarium decemcellulare]